MGRRGGGVAVYVTSELQSSRWTPAAAAVNSALEINWVRVGDRTFIAALYHPPRPTYRPEDLLEYVEACVAEITHDFPLSDIVIAGDVNQLPDHDVVERTGLMQIVHQPTRGMNVLDKIYVSSPDIYSTVRVVASVVKSDHKAVVAFPDSSCAPQKTSRQYIYRPHTPAQHAEFLRHSVNVEFTNPCPTASSDPATNVQAEFDHFYAVALELLNLYYPERVITKTSRDPAYITPRIKAMLRRKNKLMRAGRVEEAGALSVRVGQAIQNSCRTLMSQYNGKTDVGKMWAAVRRLTGRQQLEARVDGITAETLNQHYAGVSSDPQYVAPNRKPFTDEDEVPPQCVSEWQVFRALDTLRHTAAGLDGLPAWFLRVAAPVFCTPVAYLFNLSLQTSTVPQQWKEARIRPVPKVAAPVQHSDFRPISVTPILTRMMERAVVRDYIYPAFLTPPLTLTFLDQFAFRPTGSTSAAIITLLSKVTDLLQSNPYVVVISLDFSKAFDTVRHSTLLAKVAELDLPVPVYNWIVDFFEGHAHRTVFNGEESSTAGI